MYCVRNKYTNKQSTHPSIHPSVYLSTYLPTHPPNYLPISFTHYTKKRLYCGIHNSLPLVPILSQTNKFKTLHPVPFKMHFNIILSLMLMSSKWSRSFMYPNQTHVYFPPYVSHAPPTSPVSLTSSPK